MIPTLKYFWITVKHRWFVFLAGLKLGVPIWRLATHDLSKFSSRELSHYGKKFFGTGADPQCFSSAWVHHQNCNDHHWQYWIDRDESGKDKPIRMPYYAALEMIADWIGASRAYEKQWPTAENWPWLKKNFDKIRVHPETKLFLAETLKRFGYIKRVDLKDRKAGRGGISG